MSSDLKACCESNGDQASQSQAETDSEKQIDASQVSVFDVPQMDCPSEENLIRTAFASLTEELTFEFDIPNRRVQVYHSNIADTVEKTMKSVGLGATLISLDSVDHEVAQAAQATAMSNQAQESQVLRWLLLVNAVMFVLEFGVGVIAQSTGLIADSMDMFADAAVYGVSLYAVGKAASLKLKAAHLSGWLQLLLALGVLLEVTRRAIYGSEPVSDLMMAMGAVALIANVVCLFMIFKSRNQGAHMKASWIFSANDVVANAGVIAAGILVAMTGSQVPDLVIGVIIGLVVLNGARRILLLK